ncbi:MAG: class I SAM-dependent methyltransferase [Zoogloeaceae bacterium]|jgi:ubiquinone/menaquinone biosynthesis C-methylase UbiE|nr:class I SAM-dependent methyltransferase [Zoogloeaceae bacterium]
MKTVMDYYDRIAADYDRSRFANSYGAWLHAQEAAFLNRHLPGDGAMLSLGCGTGRFMERCTHGADISLEMLKAARANFPEKTFVLFDGQTLPFDSGAFRAVICLHVFMHLPPETAKRLATEVTRVLREDGVFIFDAPSALRRKVTKYQAQGWHGATAYAPEDIDRTFAPLRRVAEAGIALLPVHRIPVVLRPPARAVENLLLRVFPALRRYASHTIFACAR